ncbi:acetyltransferase (GNAT) family protein [Hydrogenispora ethanolica]|uniref:Acetyltransferase (GNAT) family protein n=1 Tax=Hydrogenispora ethanolica TaxID=1082276 RepID=A0A4R1SBS5_HYDET|nr:GNAT family N-acetyltransferase [Hydrogenispora ethanolica]TCL76948.1 acetyltransferase (GNAT) family protein [Hydrogenispora ethanolica]
MTDFITLNAENIATEHICCALSDPKGRCGSAAKKDWLRERFPEGLVFRKAAVRGKVFIEYLPAEKAWFPVEAEGFTFINCLWVAGSYQGQGYGRKLLEECVAASRAKGKRGVVAVSSAKKRPFLSDKRFLEKHGFTVCDRAEPYFELLCLKFDAGSPEPRFRENARSLTVPQAEGLALYYSHQCPFTADYSGIVARQAQALGVPVYLKRYESCDEAQQAPCPASTFSLFYRGRFVTHEIPTEKKLRTLLNL